jgi:hypothetical protein
VEWAPPDPAPDTLDPEPAQVQAAALPTPAILVPPLGSAAFEQPHGPRSGADAARGSSDRSVVEDEETADRASGRAETTWVPDELTRGDPSVAFEEDSRDLPRLDTAEVVPLESDPVPVPVVDLPDTPSDAERADPAHAPAPPAEAADEPIDEVDVVPEDAPDVAEEAPTPDAPPPVVPAAHAADAPATLHLSATAPVDPSADASTDPKVDHTPFVRPDPAPPEENPLPDQVVVLAISVFLLVATGVLVWALIS